MGALLAIYLAGGCFWGMEELFSRIPGVVEVVSGYAQSEVANPSYEEVCSGKTGAAETVRVVYNPDQVTLETLLDQYFRVIDPLSRDRQGNDVGSQYRTGIWYENPAAAPVIEKAMAAEARKYGRPLAVETGPLRNFYPAEEYHQDYLKKNPRGYCHINFDGLKYLPNPWKKPDDAELKKSLSPVQYHITRENGTEPPFSGEYWNHFEKGVYVDVASGEPLFLSSDKFESGCGWPSFSKPINQDAITTKMDKSHGMNRIETRSRVADSHLGHVFPDGPKQSGGLRYCINSAALRFVPYGDMNAQGYGYLKPALEGDRNAAK